MKKTGIAQPSAEANKPGLIAAAGARKQTGVRAFIQANRNKVQQKSRPSAVFRDEPPTTDLSAGAVKLARKSGALNLSGRALNQIPPKVWTINELDEAEKSSVSVSLDKPSEEKWWEFVDLQKLILANNSIREIPTDLKRLRSLQTLDAHDNVIENLPEEIAFLEYLNKLNLSHNKIQHLPEGLFKLKRLAELQLSHNKIEEISKNVGYLSYLQTLNLSHNCLTSLPEEIGFLSYMTSLNLSNNMLIELPHDFVGLTGLRVLDVSENQLTKLPKNFGDLIHLEIVYFQQNKLKAIPCLKNCNNLKEVFLSYNLINYFDSSLFSLTTVQLLDFRCNKIDHLKIQREHLEYVDRFYLDNNDLAELPNDIALLPSLKSLTLEGNPIRSIRPDILHRGTGELLKFLRAKAAVPADREGSPGAGVLPGARRSVSPNRTLSTSESSSACGSPNSSALDFHKLKSTRVLNLNSRNLGEVEQEVFETAGKAEVNVVDLTKNTLASLPSSIQLVGEYLNELKLDSNRLTSIPSCIGAFKRLQFLSLQGNQLQSLPDEFSNLNNLREINFSYNKFLDFPQALYGLEKLEIVIAADNKIISLEAERLREMKQLSVLDVRNNNIAQLPPEIGLMKQLRSFLVEGNAFRVPGYHIISKGTPALLNYLSSRCETKQ